MRPRRARHLGERSRCRHTLTPPSPPLFNSRTVAPPPAALTVDEDVKKALFVGGFAAALWKNVELSVGTVLQVRREGGR